jgi:hypothetical protein
MFGGGFVRPADEYLNLIPKKQGSALKAYKNPPIKKKKSSIEESLNIGRFSLRVERWPPKPLVGIRIPESVPSDQFIGRFLF